MEPETYLLIKRTHILLAVLTVFSFTVRGVLMLRGSSRLRGKWVRVAPHVIDTFLLITGLTLAVSLYGQFYRYPWLMAKLGAIIAYIVLGTIALKRGRTRAIRVLALIGSFLVLVYIFSVVLTRSPLPFS